MKQKLSPAPPGARSRPDVASQGFARAWIRAVVLLTTTFAVFASVGGATGAVSAAAGSAAVSTVAASADKANLWIDTNGGSCTRQSTAGSYVDARTCGSTTAAYAAASAGDTIAVRAGTYGRQVIPSGSKRLTIRNARGATPVFGTTKVDASNIALTGIKIQRNDDPGPFVATLEVNGANNTLDRVNVDSRFMRTPVNGRQGILNVGDHNVFKNGSTYNVVDDKGALIGGKGVTFDNFDFHDVRASNELVHNECAYSLGPNLTVKNSHFWNCATMDLFIERGTWFGQPLYCCLTLENNVFEHSTQVSQGSWHYYSLGVHGGDVQEMRNWRVVNNTFETTAGADLPAPGTVWANNIGSWSCNPGATYSHNVGTKCSASDTAVSPDTSCGPPGCSRPVTAPFRWANPAGHDFHLTSRSPAINRGDPDTYPASDKDRKNRLVGSAPDAGAFEFSGPTATTGILAIGDFGVGARPQRRLGAAVRSFEKRNPAALAVALGNNDRTRGRAFDASWRASFGWLRAAGIGVAGALGNRDVEVRRGRYQFRLLGMPAAYYARRVRSVQLIVLDSNAVTTAQTRWLRRTLARRSSLFRVVVLHDPPFACGGTLGDTAVRKRWVPLFERYGVRLVLSAGDRNYQRFEAGRVTYLVHGGAGSGPLSPLRSCPRSYPTRSSAKLSHGFLYFTVDAGGVLVRAVDLAGRTIDRFRVP